jgi:hypothetical protein
MAATVASTNSAGRRGSAAFQRIHSGSNTR